ncbi:hypothetical protein SPBR_00746 [Sporothrix brasiliensis 5110]|uniref:Alpha-taxilin n=1 Tax=Sporothrix brasiliensis 5110 TaxID=1398154 RepID=A0A0C2IVN8_9PEZI|nr:uncharacterized protein SPBR_00746 [Sporothrix brasiliensis 5110]KIH90865.1 hypothetical protein SPBR_00746 [Sporothrix brasiliensis 5110]
MNGHAHDTRPAPPPPPPPPAASGSAQAAPAPSKAAKAARRQPTVASNEASKLVAQKIAQLELDQAGEKDQELEIEKEVRKANRELNSQTAKMDAAQKADHLSRRCTELLHEMKRHERESLKNKKRADQLQKDRDQSRTELSKATSLKEKLEKLCRELQKENNKLKVRMRWPAAAHSNENRTLKANEVSNLNSWDQKYATLLQKLDDLQEEKDHPKKHVVDVELDELFRQRFKSMIDQYELRELHFHSLMRTKELEVQYNMARFERERKRAEAEVALSHRLNEQVQNLSRSEAKMQAEMKLILEKIEQAGLPP